MDQVIVNLLGPENLQRTVKVLCLAASQNVLEAKLAEEELKSLQTLPGFHLALLAIALDRSQEEYSRWMGFLCLKNGIERNWRVQSSSCISDEEKQAIKEKILLTFNEPVLQLATQGCFVIGSIARQDIRSWPKLIPSIMEAVKGNDRTVHNHALLALNEVCKSLAKKRLMADRLLFRKLSETIFDSMVEIWGVYLGQLQQCSMEEQETVTMLASANLVAKVLKKLVSEGSRSFGVNSLQMKYLKQLLQMLNVMIQSRHEWSAHTNLALPWYQLVLTLMKTIVEVQKAHAVSFIPQLHASILLCGQFLSSSSGSAQTYSKLTILCSSLLRGIIRCQMYKVPKATKAGGVVNVETVEAHKVKLTVLTEDALRNLFNQLVCSYLPLTQEDIDQWEDDPEAYLTEDPGDSCNFSTRASIESLFLALMYEYREIFTPLINNLVESAKASDVVVGGDISADVCTKKDAVYYVVGLASYELFRDLDFDAWFSRHLYKELRMQDPRMRILRHRITWLVGRWFNVALSASNRRLIYELLPTLLKDNDMVVRLTAANTVKQAVNDFTFVASDFLPFAGDILSAVCILLKEVVGYDTKITLLAVISNVIDSIDYEICPFVEGLFAALQQSWHESLDHFELLCSIVRTFNCLVKASRSSSVPMQSFLVPLICQTTNLKQPQHVYLLDDSLTLWSSIMKNSTEMSMPLLQLSDNLFPVFDLASESLPRCLSITTSYLLLDCMAFLKHAGLALGKVFNELLGKRGCNENLELAQLVETVALISPISCVEVFKEVLPDVIDAAVEDTTFPPVLNSYLNTMGLIMFADKSMFFRVIGDFCRLTSNKADDVVAKYFDIWLEKFHSMSRTEHRTTTAVCFFGLLDVNESFVVERYMTIIDMACSVLADYDGSITSSWGEEVAELPNSELETEESKRLRQVRLSSRIHQINLKDYFLSKFRDARLLFGNEHFEAIIATVDKTVIQQLLGVIGPM